MWHSDENLFNYLIKQDVNKINLDMGLKCVQALKSLHDNGYLHRSLSLESFMIKTNDQIYLSNLNNSKKIESAYTVIYDFLLGIEQYIAPETKSENQYSVYSDIYALGLVLEQFNYEKLKPIIESMHSKKQFLRPELELCEITFILEINKKESDKKISDYLATMKCMTNNVQLAKNIHNILLHKDNKFLKLYNVIRYLKYPNKLSDDDLDKLTNYNDHSLLFKALLIISELNNINYSDWEALRNDKALCQMVIDRHNQKKYIESIKKIDVFENEDCNNKIHHSKKNLSIEFIKNHKNALKLYLLNKKDEFDIQVKANKNILDELNQHRHKNIAIALTCLFSLTIIGALFGFCQTLITKNFSNDVPSQKKIYPPYLFLSTLNKDSKTCSLAKEATSQFYLSF